MLALKVLIPLQAAAVLGMCSVWLLSLNKRDYSRPPKHHQDGEEGDLLTSCLSEFGVPYVTSHDSNHTIWAESTTPYNSRLAYMPRAVVVPQSVRHIQDAVTCAGTLSVRVTAKSGGHSFASSGLGGEDGHLVVDLSLMEKVTLQKDNVTAIIQPGARLGHVALQLYEQGKRAISHGSCPGVGIGGHVLHGGFGFSSRSRGLTLDYLRAATVVLANSSVVRCSETENPDLFWALRGAGSAFGIVTELEFDTFAPPSSVVAFTVDAPFRDADTIAACLAKLQEMALSAPKELDMLFFAGPLGVYLTGTFDGSQEALGEVLAPVLNVTKTAITDIETVDWIKSLQDFTFGPELDQKSLHYHAHANFYVSSAMTPALEEKQIRRLSKLMQKNLKSVSRTETWNMFLELHGGGNSAVFNAGPHQGSFPHRDKLLLWQFAYHLTGINEDQEQQKKKKKQDFPTAKATKLVKKLRDTVTSDIPDGQWGMYANYPDSELKPEAAQKLYYGRSLPRLQRIKAALDPKAMFYSPGGVIFERDKNGDAKMMESHE
ncbi:FAD-linked oxidoreductase subF [Cladobotryum mycophilum]|uniref:FAD-linked oxidoreductase subF n=1 Tax=Cladobotryum mycophilum TaxID=491253 RepID=A0ABR0SK99_9HYPO